MRATDVLKAEHRAIERVLDCLDTMAVRCYRQGILDTVSALQAIDFFRHFADGCHHHKEEQHLFPLLETRGMTKERGPIGVMLHEHDEGRQLLSSMDAAVVEWNNGNRQAGDSFARAAEEYSALLRQHISKEDHCLFAMADHVLSNADQADLLAAFQRAEHEDLREGKHAYYLNLANELTRKYCATPVTESSCQKGGCVCSHA